MDYIHKEWKNFRTIQNILLPYLWAKTTRQKGGEVRMTKQRMLELLEIEHECMLRGAHDDCDRNCADCELVQDDGELHEMYTDVIALLKEQEFGHWIFLTDCSNSGVYCSECNTKVFDSYPFKKKFSYFCPHCGTRMEGEIERR